MVFSEWLFTDVTMIFRAIVNVFFFTDIVMFGTERKEGTIELVLNIILLAAIEMKHSLTSLFGAPNTGKFFFTISTLMAVTFLHLIAYIA